MRRLLPDAHVSHHSLWGFCAASLCYRLVLLLLLLLLLRLFLMLSVLRFGTVVCNVSACSMN